MTPEELVQRLDQEAHQDGYWVNPDRSLALMLAEGLLVNEGRYGYESCPCRLASGNIEEDRDIVCPCEYRYEDVREFGTCYCGLFVDQDVAAGKKTIGPIPERRPTRPQESPTPASHPAVPVWRCVICGYLCARTVPPAICPICRARREKFEAFNLSPPP